MPSVLIAAHDPNQAALWSTAFDADGRWHVVATACSFAHARQTLLRERPDLLVTELRLADGTATDLVRVLRAGFSPLPTQILVVTREADRALLMDALLEGADNFVADDAAAPSRLVQHARETLAGSAEIAPWVARKLLELFGADAPPPGARAYRRTPIEDLANPLALTDAERHLLRSLSSGFRVGELANTLGVGPRELTGRVRGIYRKLQWQLRAGNLSLQAGLGTR